MADVGTFVGVKGSETFNSQDTVTLTYEILYDSLPSNFYTALSRGRAATGTPLPARRSLYASPSSLLFAQGFASDCDFRSDARNTWRWDVTFGTAPPGELDTFEVENPLDRPPVYDIQYMDREEVIAKARNVTALSHGDGKGANRAADTEGPIVNAAGKRPDEPLVDTTRLEVLVITRNYPNLASIIALNRAFRKSTNTDEIEGYGARELGYLLTESLGEQYENGTRFYPGVTTILADETTDLVIDNVGYEYWDVAGSKFVRAVDGDGNFTADPINLKLDGDAGGDTTTTITYRYKNEMAYGGLIS